MAEPTPPKAPQGATVGAARAASGQREALLKIARDPATRAGILDMVARDPGADEEIHLALLRNTSTPAQAREHLARVGGAAVLEALAAEEAGLRDHPAVALAVLENPAADEAVRAAAQALPEGGGEEIAPPARAAVGILDRSRLLEIARDPGADPANLNVVGREAGADAEILTALLRHPRTPDALLVYIALVGTPPILNEILAKPERLRNHPAIAQAMLENGEADDALRVKIRAVLTESPEEAAKRPLPLYQFIKGLSAGQRLALAMKGSKEARMLLIKDPNEMVALEVIYSPRITETEILAIAQMRDVHEQVLRAIASNKQHRANKPIVWALLNNPKTPAGVSVGLGLGNLSEKELEALAKNRNIPSALQRAARSALERKRRRTGGHGR